MSEVMVVVAIVGVLAATAGISYTVFSDKAKSVEAETALNEVNRLEMMYYDARGQYSSDLEAIGYMMTPPLKHYTVEIEVTPGVPGVRYRATAKPIGKAQQESWALTRYENGNTVLEKMSATATVGSASGTGSGESLVSTGGSSETGVSASAKGSNGTGPGTVIQMLNGSSPTAGSMGSGGNQAANSSPTAPHAGP